MDEAMKKTQSSVCTYRKIKIDIRQQPLKLPRIEEFHGNYRLKTLLTKIKSLNTTLIKKKYSNTIALTLNRRRESNCDNKLLYTTWKNLAIEHTEYLEMYKTVELQNMRINRLKIRN